MEYRLLWVDCWHSYWDWWVYLKSFFQVVVLYFMLHFFCFKFIWLHLLLLYQLLSPQWADLRLLSLLLELSLPTVILILIDHALWTLMSEKPWLMFIIMCLITLCFEFGIENSLDFPLSSSYPSKVVTGTLCKSMLWEVEIQRNGL